MRLPSSKVPVQIRDEDGWIYVSAGIFNSAGIRNGRLYTWGCNFKGNLGTGDRKDRPTPEEVGGEGWTMVSALADYSLGIRSGKLFAWGEILGKVKTDRSSRDRGRKPAQVGTRFDWSSICIKRDRVLGLANGCLFSWDQDFPLAVEGQLTPQQGGSFRSSERFDWEKVSLGSHHLLAVRDGTLFSCGENHHGQLGFTPRVNSLALAPISFR